MPALLQRPGSCDTTQPFLKWLGGKRELVSREIRPLYDQVKPIGRLVEPFCGSAAVALGLGVEHALLADANPHLINLFHAIQDGKLLRAPYGNDAEQYYEARDAFNRLIEKGIKTVTQQRKAASLFYYLNRHCFNGLIRFNAKGGFNAAFGRYKTVWYENLSSYQDVLHAWDFKNQGYMETLADVRPTDFVYVDPPYDKTFTQYSKGGFTWDDQLRLAERCAELDCPVVVSNSGTDRIQSLYKRLGFQLKTVSVPRRISCDGNRDAAIEIIATKGF